MENRHLSRLFQRISCFEFRNLTFAAPSMEFEDTRKNVIEYHSRSDLPQRRAASPLAFGTGPGRQGERKG